MLPATQTVVVSQGGNLGNNPNQIPRCYQIFTPTHVTPFIFPSPTATPTRPIDTPTVSPYTPTLFDFPKPKPIPVDELVEMAPGFPDYSRYQVLIIRHNALRELWDLGLWMPESTISLGPGDCVENEYIDDPNVTFTQPGKTTTVVAAPPKNINLQNDQSSDSVLLEIKTNPPYGSLYQTNYSNCNQIPDLRIWGDGRVAYFDPSKGLLVGAIDYHPILDWLVTLHFFDPWIIHEDVRPGGGGGEVDLDIKLSSGSFSYFSYGQNGLTKRIMAIIDENTLTPYFPEEAKLNIKEFHGYLPQGDFPAWPTQLGFIPEDALYTNFTVKGADLAFVWRYLLEHNNQVVGFNYLGRDYLVWLTIPEVMNDEGECNPAINPTLPPTPYWLPYPPPVTPFPDPAPFTPEPTNSPVPYPYPPPPTPEPPNTPRPYPYPVGTPVTK